MKRHTRDEHSSLFACDVSDEEERVDDIRHQEVLDSERRRLEKEKAELELDLGSATTEKFSVEKKISEIEEEKNSIQLKVEELLAEKARLEERLEISDRETSSLTSELADIRDVAMKQKLSLDNKDQIIGDLVPIL